MNTKIQEYLASVRLEDPQVYQNIVLFPLSTNLNGSPAYITLGEAVSNNTLTITEISQGGSVSELLVINRGEQPVLLLDGEELIGAKQNRVLNTTILLREKTETKIPVSCTEHGRWAYSSPNFAPSTVIMEHKTRARKSRSVSASLAQEQAFKSDQAEVWDNISALGCKAKTSSPTGAMHDVFKAYEANLKECLEKFVCQPGQHGLLVTIGGKVAGFDVISRPEAYARLHPKLVRSYVLDALLEPKRENLDLGQAGKNAQDFKAEIGHAKETKFQSVGYGWDFRFESPGLAGTALAVDEHVVHAAFFRLDPVENRDSMASLRQRRRHVID